MDLGRAIRELTVEPIAWPQAGADQAGAEQEPEREQEPQEATTP